MSKAANAFELEEKAVRILDAVTVAPKERDEDRKPGLYLIVGYTAANDDLAMIHPSLKSAFYQKRKTEPAQGEIPGTEATGLTELKYPFFNKPIKVDKAMIGCALSVAYGIGESDIEIDGVDVDNFKIHMKDGGSVYFQFRLKVHVSEGVHGKLSQLKNEEITITLTAPEAKQEEIKEAA
jgi:hypothetical protein